MVSVSLASQPVFLRKTGWLVRLGECVVHGKSKTAVLISMHRGESCGPPSLDQLVEAVPAERLDQACRDEDLLELSLSLTNWQSVSPFLGLSEADEEDIEKRSSERQRIDVLRKWRAKFGSTATYR